MPQKQKEAYSSHSSFYAGSFLSGSENYFHRILSGIPIHEKNIKSDPDNDDILVRTVSEMANNQDMCRFRAKPLDDSVSPPCTGVVSGRESMNWILTLPLLLITVVSGSII